MNHKPTRPTVGPRGGSAVQATPCSDCVAYRSCRPAAITEPWGCESWVDQDGRRALPDLPESEPVSPCEPCGCPEVEVEPEGGGFTFETLGGLLKGHVLSNSSPNPEPFRPAVPFVPDPSRGEGAAQSVLPMPDAGPLFAGCLEVRR